METLLIRVPASTSNLGPGFDLLGLALGLFLEVEATRSPTASAHTWEQGTGFAASWPPHGNLVERAFDAVFARAGLTPPVFTFRAKSEIPMARGLGSSGAAVAAGLLLANAALKDLGKAPFEGGALHELGIAIEGHPDNVTASLFGGCTLCLPADAQRTHPTALVHQEVTPTLGFAVAWSQTTLATARAREVLPASVPFADAVENPRRLAMLLEGLRTGNPDLLRIGAHDRLHHEARLALIPGGREALARASEAGAYLTAINGSGSSLLAMGSREAIPKLAACLGETLAQFDEGIVTKELELVSAPPVVTRC